MATRSELIQQTLGNAEKAYDSRTKAQQQADAAKEKEKDRDFARIKEKTEILDGSRSAKVMGQSAVRFTDIAQLGNFPSLPTARPVTAAPTAAEYNSLLDDVKRIYEALGAISAIIKRKV